MMPSDFRNSVAETVKHLSLHESNWKAEGWKNLWGQVNQDVLNDAFNQHGVIRSIFSDMGQIDTRTTCKTIARVQKKMTEQTPGRENFFKVVSDFDGVRIPCDVTEITRKIDHIKEIVRSQGGQIYIRGESNERPYGFFMSQDKKYSDITQYVYVFLEKVGYPIEIQIGHPFAAHTFAVDSELRNNPACGKVDLWGKNFYSDVKKFLLDKANHEPLGSKEALMQKAVEIHQGNIPEELKTILDKI